MSTTFYIYRHAKTAWNKEGRLQGWLDSSLVEAVLPAALEVDYVVSSDLQRAVTTAHALFPEMPIHTDVRLREIYLGHWQGQYIADLMKQADYTCYAKTPAQFFPTTQEAFSDVTTRVVQVLRELSALEHERIAIVSHGVAIACLQCAIDKAPLSDLWRYMLEGAEFITVKSDALIL